MVKGYIFILLAFAFGIITQLWTLGYHQCRWNYDNQTDVKTVIAKFDKYRFPLDGIWLDIEYTDAKKYFTWNPVNFTDPLEMQRNISSTNRHLVTIIDPHIKVDHSYAVYKGAHEQGLFVKNANGSDFQGDCWPGLSSYMDFLNPKARKYYADYYSYQKFSRSTPVLAGIWNDMNEPSVFDDTIEKTLPGDVVHYGGVEHKDVHNIYGFLHHMSTHEGLMRRDNGTKRPFILTRSHFAGSQRYTAIWTGDNTADWIYLAISYSQCLTSNILGIVFCGADVGGFFGNPSVELLQRWYQAGAWLPFYRSHANLGTPRREPYLYTAEVQNVIRNAIKLRYKHLPIWYTLFYEHTRNGDPVIRPLFYHYPEDPNLYAIDNQLMLGRDILVRAITEPGVKSVPVYLPGGENQTWFDERNNEYLFGSGWINVSVNINSIPVYYRAGGIIARKDTERRSSAEMENDGHNLYVILDKNNTASTTLYLDDNTSFKYQSHAEYNYLYIKAINNTIYIEHVDYSNSKHFEFKLDSVEYLIPTQSPNQSKPGKYVRVVHKRDAQGVLLTEKKIKSSERTVLNFN